MELGLNLKHFLLQLPHFIGAERWWLWSDRKDERQASCCFHGTSGSQSCCPLALLTYSHFWFPPGPVKIESLQVEPRFKCYLRASRWRWCAAKVEGQITIPHCSQFWTSDKPPWASLSWVLFEDLPYRVPCTVPLYCGHQSQRAATQNPNTLTTGALAEPKEETIHAEYTQLHGHG